MQVKCRHSRTHEDKQDWEKSSREFCLSIIIGERPSLTLTKLLGKEDTYSEDSSKSPVTPLEPNTLPEREDIETIVLEEAQAEPTGLYKREIIETIVLEEGVTTQTEPIRSQGEAINSYCILQVVLECPHCCMK